MLNLNLKTGDKAYFIDRFVQNVHQCEIEYVIIDPQTKAELYRIHDLTTVGHLTVPKSELYLHENDAKSALCKENHERLMQFKKEIGDANDLVCFALNHCLFGEYRDDQAALAYKLRAEELGFSV